MTQIIQIVYVCSLDNFVYNRYLVEHAGSSTAKCGFTVGFLIILSFDCSKLQSKNELHSFNSHELCVLKHAVSQM